MSWEQLVDVYRVARLEAESERNSPPAACPNDGEPLKQGPNGELFCPSDGWQWPRDAVLR